MASVGLFFGSDTGNTGEHVAKMIQKVGKQLIDVKDIAKSSKEDIAEFGYVFGIPTWYYGEAQCDWDDFFPELKQIDFNATSWLYFLVVEQGRLCRVLPERDGHGT